MSESGQRWTAFFQTLAATLVGGAIVVVGNLAVQDRLLQSQEEGRAFESRVEAYASFNQMSTAFLDGPVSPDDYELFNYSLSQLSLLASEVVRLAAADVHLEAMRIQQGDTAASKDELSHARAAFRFAVQRELGLID